MVKFTGSMMARGQTPQGLTLDKVVGVVDVGKKVVACSRVCHKTVYSTLPPKAFDKQRTQDTQFHPIAPRTSLAVLHLTCTIILRSKQATTRDGMHGQVTLVE